MYLRIWQDYTSAFNYYEINQNYGYFKKLIERALINKRDGKDTNLDRIILELFWNYILIIPKPEIYLEKTISSLHGEKRAQGRFREEDSKAGLKNLNLDEIPPKNLPPLPSSPLFNSKVNKTKAGENLVYLHFYRPTEKTAFAITSLFESLNKDIRILDDGDSQFRDSNIEETFVYNYLFDKMYNKILKKYREKDYYGTYILRGGEDEINIAKKRRNFFRIVNTEGSRNKGQICKTDKIENLVKVIKYLEDKKGEYKEYYEGKSKRELVCEKLKKIFKEKGLLFFSL